MIVGIVAAAQSLVILTAGHRPVGGRHRGACPPWSWGQFTFRFGLPPAVAIALVV